MLLSPAAYAAEPMAINAPTATLAVTTSSARVAYGAGNTSYIVVSNDGGVSIFCKSGNSSVTAATTDTAIIAGSIQSYMKSPVDTHMACIAGSGSSTAYIQTGSGE